MFRRSGFKRKFFSKPYSFKHVKKISPDFFFFNIDVLSHASVAMPLMSGYMSRIRIKLSWNDWKTISISHWLVYHRRRIIYGLISISVVLNKLRIWNGLNWSPLCLLFCLCLVEDHVPESQTNDKAKLINQSSTDCEDENVEKKRKGKISKIAGSCFLGCGISKQKQLLR